MLKLGGVSCNTLLEKCGSPLYVYEEEKIEKQLRDYKNNFKSDKFDTEVLYASKAFTCTSMVKKAMEFNCGLDVVSGGELYVAKKAGMDPSKIYFHGNNKLEDEIIDALKYNVKTLVMDNMYEVEKIIALSEKLDKDVHVLIRINPKVEAHTHEFIMTATGDSKFGISIDLKDEIAGMIAKCKESTHVYFDGFHCHIGSQIFEREAFVLAIDKMGEFIAQMETLSNTKVKVLNIGGGFGVHYTDEDNPTPTPLMCKKLIEALEKVYEKYHLSLDKVCMEPGRSIVAEAGTMLYTVGFTKKTLTKEFVFIDGGMADNIRPALYNAKYACDVANKMEKEKTHTYEIAGKCCESGDIIIHDALLPKVESGDILAVYSVGAYGYSMSSNYNRINRAAVVFVKDGKVKVVIRRETYEDQLRSDCVEEVSL